MSTANQRLAGTCCLLYPPPHSPTLPTSLFCPTYLTPAPPISLPSCSLDELTVTLRELPMEDASAAFVAAVCAERGRLEEGARRAAAQQGSCSPHQVVMCAEPGCHHSGHSKGPAPSREPEAEWSEEEMEVLVKAVNLFPPGTTDR